jgi:DNA-binding transcriptional LysR family regulator
MSSVMAKVSAMIRPQGSTSIALPVRTSSSSRPTPLVCLARSANPGFVALIDDCLKAVGLRPRILQRARDIQTVLALVTAGIGAALVSARAGAIAPGLRLLPVDHPAARWRIALAWQPRDQSRTLAAFVESARDIASSSASSPALLPASVMPVRSGPHLNR